MICKKAIIKKGLEKGNYRKIMFILGNYVYIRNRSLSRASVGFVLKKKDEGKKAKRLHGALRGLFRNSMKSRDPDLIELKKMLKVRMPRRPGASK